jgi:competence protein ComEC
VNPFQSFLDDRERWFLWIPVFMASGIAVYFALPFEPAFSACLASPLFLLGFLFFRRFFFTTPVLACLLAFSLGFNAAQFETSLIKKPLLDVKLEPTSVTGTLIRAEALPEGSRLTLQSPSIKDLPREDRPRLVRVKVRTPFADLPEAGSRVNLWGPLWPPADPALPDGYDFRRQAFFKQIGATGLSYVELRERDSRYPIHFFWDGFYLMFEKARRALILMTYERLNAPEQVKEKAMTAALLSGSQTAIDQDTMQAMRASGLSHLLSISGVHVSMMALLVYIPLRFLLALFPWVALRFSIKKWAAGAAIIATSLYTLLVGADAPTVRSALTTALIMLAIIMDRKALSLRLVALAAIAIMLVTPSAAMGASFQMSFAAVLAMVAVYEKQLDVLLKDGWSLAERKSETTPSPHRLSFLGRHLKDIVFTSLIATAATTPFTIFHFQSFNFYGVIANIIAIPLTTLWVMPFLLLTYITAPFGTSGWFIDAAGWGVKGIILLAEKVASWPLAQLYLPPMPAWALLSFLAGGFWLCLWRKRWRYAGLLPIAAVFFYPLTVSQPDAFIAADAPVWAVRLSDGSMAIYGKREENFTTAQWRQHSGNPEAHYFSARNLPEFDKDLFCDETHCLYERGAFSVMFLMPPPKGQEAAQAGALAAAPPAAPPACPTTTVTVAFVPMPPCKGTIMIDQAALTKGGAQTLTFEKKGTVRIDTVRTEGRLRPWSVGWRHESKKSL